MNKIVDTSTRVFMAVVGPSGSGTKDLIFKLLKGKTFYPRFKRAIFFYTESQPMYSEKGSLTILTLSL